MAPVSSLLCPRICSRDFSLERMLIEWKISHMDRVRNAMVMPVM